MDVDCPLQPSAPSLMNDYTTIVVSDQAAIDLSKLPKEVGETFHEARDEAENKLETYANADLEMVFEKRMSGSLHPLLQETYGGEHRGWFIEGSRANNHLKNSPFEDKIYCLRVLTADEAHKLEDKGISFLEVLRSAL